VVPLPHQLYALNRAISRDRIRYLLADEVGLGKTIEAGLVLRELKLRGRVKRILVVAPKGLVRQWQAEMRLHFGEKLQFIEPSELAAFRQWRSGAVGDEDNLWRMHDQVICSLDSVKPLEARRGWSLEQLNTYNRERFEDLISASWDLVIIDEAHRMGGSTEQVARYKLGAALAEASPYLLLLTLTNLTEVVVGEAFRVERLTPFDAVDDDARAVALTALLNPSVTGFGHACALHVGEEQVPATCGGRFQNLNGQITARKPLFNQIQKTKKTPWGAIFINKNNDLQDGGVVPL
jgi:SNF2 family DNA or RNA helicase